MANPFWLGAGERRLRREKAFGEMKISLLQDYVGFVETLVPVSRSEDNIDQENHRENGEKIFTLWLQGEENAPEIVRKCIESIRKLYPERLVVLDENNISDWIKLPDYIEEKWKKGLMIPAHYADIIRLELLYRYGGYWSDATCFWTGTIPGDIEVAEFFMYVTGNNKTSHMFVHNCFIRARKGSGLLEMWRETVLEYWRKEDSAKAYYLVHFLLKLLVDNNQEAKKLFEIMPRRETPAILKIWEQTGNRPYEPEEYKKITDNAFFQKCSYKPHKGWVNGILPGSMAEHMVNGNGN